MEGDKKPCSGYALAEKRRIYSENSRGRSRSQGPTPALGHIVPLGGALGSLKAHLVQKKEGLSSRQPNLLINLKSNTMKNTVQKYCFFLKPPNKKAEKYVF